VDGADGPLSGCEHSVSVIPSQPSGRSCSEARSVPAVLNVSRGVRGWARGCARARMASLMAATIFCAPAGEPRASGVSSVSSFVFGSATACPIRSSGMNRDQFCLAVFHRWGRGVSGWDSPPVRRPAGRVREKRRWWPMPSGAPRLGHGPWPAGRYRCGDRRRRPGQIFRFSRW